MVGRIGRLFGYLERGETAAVFISVVSVVAFIAILVASRYAPIQEVSQNLFYGGDPDPADKVVRLLSYAAAGTLSPICYIVLNRMIARR